MEKRRRSTQNMHRGARNRPAPLIDAPSKYVQAAYSLWSMGRDADALNLFSEAIRHEPNNVRTYVMAARAYARKFDFRQMEQTHEDLVRRAPRHPGVHHYIGETFGLLKLPERAMASYEQAARLPGGGAPTWMELASLYERAHRLDEAEDMIERTVQAGFDLPLVWLVRGRIQRRRNQPDLAEATFRSLIGRVRQDSDWACQAWSELALMKDSQGDFEGAINAIERCKQAQRSRERGFTSASEKIIAPMREMVAEIGREDFRRWRDAAAHLAPRRLALLAGFPRSGTTLLEQVLDAHPDLVSSEERDFIGRDLFFSIVAHGGKTPLMNLLHALRVEFVALERERYFQAMEYLLGEPVGSRMHLDKNPAYTLTIPLLLRVFPEARLVIALRDPRDVVLSCYLRYLPLNALSVHFLDVTRTAQRYALDMTAWLKFRELIEIPWCEIRYEDTVNDLEAQARRALDTLGLAWNEAVLNYRQRLLATKQVTSPTYEAVAQPIYNRAIGRWKNYERLLAPALKTLEPFIRQFGYSP